MKRINFFAFALLALFLTSCGGSQTKKIQEVELSPYETQIKGDIGNYLEIIDDKFKVIKSEAVGKDWEITFKLKNIQTGDLSRDKYKIDLKLFLTDNTGKPITTIGEFWLADGLWSNESARDAVRELIKSDVGTEEWITLTTDVPYNSEYKETLPEGITNFTIKTIVEEVKTTSNSTKNVSTTNTSAYSSNTSSNTENWDAVLNSYEEYIDQYLVLIKKAKNNDVSAMTEYLQAMEKANDLTEKLSNASSDLSTTQMAKFNKLQIKFASAMTEFQ